MNAPIVQTLSATTEGALTSKKGRTPLGDLVTFNAPELPEMSTR